MDTTKGLFVFLAVVLAICCLFTLLFSNPGPTAIPAHFFEAPPQSEVADVSHPQAVTGSATTRYRGLPVALHSALLVYGQWHDTALRYHQNVSLVVGMWGPEPRGGFADRVKFAVNVLTVALVTRRLVLLDWSEVEPYFYSPYFEWSFQRSRVLLPPDVALHSAPNDHHGLPLLTKDWNEVFPAHVTRVTSMNVPIQHFLLFNARYTPWVTEMFGAVCTPHQINGLLQRALLQPKGKLLAALHRFQLTHLQGHTVVGLQIRTSGNGAWDDPNRLTQESHRCMMRCAVHVSHLLAPNRSLRLFLATDSDAVKQYAREVFRGNVAVAEGKITHMDKSSEADVKANILLILLDYMLLAEYTDRLVIMFSGYAFVAAWRSLLPFILHPDHDTWCGLQDAADAAPWSNPMWCPPHLPMDYKPKWPPHFPYSRKDNQNIDPFFRNNAEWKRLRRLPAHPRCSLPDFPNPRALSPPTRPSTASASRTSHRSAQFFGDTALMVVTYRNDLSKLPLFFESLQRRVLYRRLREVLLLVDPPDFSLIARAVPPYVRVKNFSFFPVKGAEVPCSRWAGHGYLHQQLPNLYADRFTKAQFAMFTDVDATFDGLVTPMSVFHPSRNHTPCWVCTPHFSHPPYAR
eukprot:GGOE01002966.1.p1 GENE.GGOE01002966.1~~GGOE01002966.1.p1  ORF type:complete len:641 (+),score=129.38 GGOE01002966.1:34-1923(+)